MFVISGTGCSLLDFIYADIAFSAAAFERFRSRQAGDGGLEPGKLVFAEDFERFAGMEVETALECITGGQAFSAANIGGPAIVALINAAQLLDPNRFQVRFTGAIGSDVAGDQLRTFLRKVPLESATYINKSGRTPCTHVLSDPRFDGGRGERTFLNIIGAAGQLRPEDLGQSFFEADLVVFGGTALVPGIHDALDSLLAEARRHKALTVVNTVYDFRHQRENPAARWPLGASDESYRLIDLLIADHEEALRLSGTSTIDLALQFFMDQGTGAVIITNGARDIALCSQSTRFLACQRSRMPVSAAIVKELAAFPERKGDTTGCGDNFAGGVIVGLARQMEAGVVHLDLREAIAIGAVCGGLTCFQMGGVLYENHPGQKQTLMEPYLAAYRQALATLPDKVNHGDPK